MDTPHRQKVDRLIVELGQQGVSPYASAPPLFRLLWRLGLNVPPPFFLGFLPLTLLTGTFFGVLWGVVMWFWVWQGEGLAASLAVPTSVFAGLLFGLGMAWLVRREAARLGLPTSWEDYPEV